MFFPLYPSKMEVTVVQAPTKFGTRGKSIGLLDTHPLTALLVLSRTKAGIKRSVTELNSKKCDALIVFRSAGSKEGPSSSVAGPNGCKVWHTGQCT